MSSLGRASVIALSAVTIWYAASLVFWALQPLSDAVPVGVDYTVDPPQNLSVEVECNTLFEPTPSNAPLPELKEQPKDAPALEFQRTPCELVHDQAQQVFVIDTGVVGLTFIGVGLLWLRHRRLTARSRTVAYA